MSALLSYVIIAQMLRCSAQTSSSGQNWWQAFPKNILHEHDVYHIQKNVYNFFLPFDQSETKYICNK